MSALLNRIFPHMPKNPLSGLCAEQGTTVALQEARIILHDDLDTLEPDEM